MSGTVLLGYDVESASDSTAGFLDGAAELHTRFDVPWSIYLVGTTVEARVDDILRHVDDPLLTIGQHTYSHMLLKSIYMDPRDGKEVHGGAQTYFNPGGALGELEVEIAKTQKVIRDLLGVECEGLTGPWGYYRGLADRELSLLVAIEGARGAIEHKRAELILARQEEQKLLRLEERHATRWREEEARRGHADLDEFAM
ncbi:hypothetical protein CMK11_06125, partial [Candidatus Poribacteria bacterium]|nr:hypothetical protein [Candidatus Poribacteria bacterium]